MEALVSSMSVTSLVFSTELVEPLKLTRRDVTEYDDGPSLSLTLSQDPFQPTELSCWICQVLDMSVGFVPQVCVQAYQTDSLRQFKLIKTTFNIFFKVLNIKQYSSNTIFLEILPDLTIQIMSEGVAPYIRD